MAKSLRKGKIVESKKKTIKEDEFDPKKLGLDEEESQDPDELNKILGLPDGDAPIAAVEAEGDQDDSVVAPLEKQLDEEDEDEVTEGDEEELKEGEDEEDHITEAEGDQDDSVVAPLEKQLDEEDDEDMCIEDEDLLDEPEQKNEEESDDEILKKLGEGEDEEDKKDELSEVVSKIFEGQNLTKEFKSKVKTLFEATVKAKVKTVREGLKKNALTVIKEQRLKNREAMLDVVSRYTSYAAKNWLAQNRVPTMDRITLELSEGAVQAVKGFLSQFNVKVPRSRENLVEKLSTANKQLTEKLDAATSREIKLQERLGSILKKGYLRQLSEGLSDTEKAKFVKLAETVSFTDEKSYRTKLQNIREGLSSGAKGSEDFASKMLMKEEKGDKADEGVTSDNPNMKKYLQIVGDGRF